MGLGSLFIHIHRRHASISLALVLLLANGVYAQAGNESPGLTDARARFDRAAAHYDGGDYALALTEFREAYELLQQLQHPAAAAVQFNIARCYTQLGREPHAIAAYERYLAETAADDPNRATAENELRELRARTSLDATPAAEVSPVGPIVLGVGGAMLVAGAITGGLALAEHGSITSMCDAATMHCPRELEARANDLAALSIAADVLLWGGLGVAVAGAVLTAVLREPAPSTSVALSCTATSCVSSVQGSF